MYRRNYWYFLVFCCAVLCAGASAANAGDLSSTHFIVRDPVLDGGGAFGSSATFRLYSAGDNPLGDGSSTNYKDHAGFLEYPSVTQTTLTPLVSGSNIDLSWPAVSAANGWTVSGYKLGIGTVSGGSYTFTSVGNVTSYTYVNKLPGTYYLVLQTLDTLGNVIATTSEVSATVEESVYFSLSANSVSFGTLTTANARYADTGSGSTSISPAHTMTAESNAASGYSLTYKGQNLSSGASTITPASISGSTTGTVGSNQFALSFTTDGTATITSSYDQSSSNWLYVPGTTVTIAQTSGPTASETFSGYYLANVSTAAAAGVYSDVITYTLTANF
jgi:hypothetical protein